MKYLFGVDGGGTGCRVVLADNTGSILSKTKGGPANIETSFSSARNNIVEACKNALSQASLPETIFENSFAVLGLAGSNMGDFDKELSKQLPFKRNLIINDGEITLEGAVGHSDGCIAAIGTGSVFTGRVNGAIRQIGGWGFILGDNGSGAKLGCDILKAAIRCHENLGTHSDLTNKIMQEFNNSIVNVVKHTLDFKPKDYAQFAPLVLEYYEKEDHNACQIINYEISIIEKSIRSAGFQPEKPFCLLGGLGNFYKKHISPEFSKFVVEPLGDAASGALSIAKRVNL